MLGLYVIENGMLSFCGNVIHVTCAQIC